MDPLTWLENFIWFCGWDHLDAKELINDPTMACYVEEGAQLDPNDQKALDNLCCDIKDYLGLWVLDYQDK